MSNKTKELETLLAKFSALKELQEMPTMTRGQAICNVERLKNKYFDEIREIIKEQSKKGKE